MKKLIKILMLLCIGIIFFSSCSSNNTINNSKNDTINNFNINPNFNLSESEYYCRSDFELIDKKNINHSINYYGSKKYLVLDLELYNDADSYIEGLGTDGEIYLLKKEYTLKRCGYIEFYYFYNISSNYLYEFYQGGGGYDRCPTDECPKIVSNFLDKNTIKPIEVSSATKIGILLKDNNALNQTIYDKCNLDLKCYKEIAIKQKNISKCEEIPQFIQGSIDGSSGNPRDPIENCKYWYNKSN